MGLALLIVVLKSIALRSKDERYNQAARFWARIFAINFLLGVVTGIPKVSASSRDRSDVGIPRIRKSFFTCSASSLMK